MKFTLSLNQGYLELKISGNYDSKKIVPLINELISHEKWAEGSMVLIDETELNLEQLDYDGVDDIVSTFEKHKEKFKATKFAIFVGRDIEYGINRMWESLSNEKTDINANVFRARDKAIEWLLKNQLLMGK
ncbi:MAG: hypothetical protein HQK61_02300 [Desulfamplus sp.]|nr:hypothetical protein [Desulfamplus sp.]